MKSLNTIRNDYRVSEVNRVNGEEFCNQDVKYEIWLKRAFVFSDGSHYETACSLAELNELLDEVEEEK
jgi:hypothetical protein